MSIIFGFEFSYTLLWIVIAIIFGIIEAVTLGLATIWFAAGALFAFLAALIGLPFVAQFMIFLISSIVLLYFTRPIMVKKLKLGSIKTNVDAVIGQTGIVTKTIEGMETGLVKVNGQIWTAITKDSTLIEKDSKIEVLAVKGVKLIVEKLTH